MKIHQLNFSCILSAPIEDVYTFHTDTRNLPRITPPWIDVTIESIERNRVSLIIKRFKLPTRWFMEITLDNPAYSITDTMLSGPFRSFTHRRTFSSLDETHTLMEECITFTLPFGWIGEFIYPLIKTDMNKMFSYRHRETQSFFINSLTIKN